MVSPQDAVLIRLEGISNDFTKTNMVPVGVKRENPALYRVSPFMDPAMAKIAVKAHRNSMYPVLDREFYEAVKQYADEDKGLEPEDRRAIILSSPEDYLLTPEMEDTRFIFGKPTKGYFDKFGHKSIKFFNLPTNDVPKNKCFVNCLWFDGPVGDSGLYAGDRDLYDEDSAFGVLRSAEGANAQNSGYSLTEIAKANSGVIPVVFNNAGVKGVTPLVARDLNKSLLESLRKGK
ncbi:MAG: hypothetical protein AABW50_03195 [Nanoarchaeota archaeon]